MDILEMKLAAGVQIRDYVKTYGDRKNEAGAFAKCMDLLPFPASSLTDLRGQT
jgi:hypothetical protein